MLVAISIAPMGADSVDADGGVNPSVIKAVQVIRDSGLAYETNAMFTNIEGEWDEVMAVVKAAVEAVAEDAPRVSFVLKADYRPGRTGELTAKAARVNDGVK